MRRRHSRIILGPDKTGPPRLLPLYLREAVIKEYRQKKPLKCIPAQMAAFFLCIGITRGLIERLSNDLPGDALQSPEQDGLEKLFEEEMEYNTGHPTSNFSIQFIVNGYVLEMLTVEEPHTNKKPQ